MTNRRQWRIAPLAVIFIALLFAAGCWSAPADSSVLKVSCAASLQQPMTMLAKRFEELHSVRIQLQFGGTSMLINQAKLTNTADVLISADQFSTDELVLSKQACECVPVVIQCPVIVTTKSAGAKIRDRMDLLRDDVKLGLGDFQATSIGKATKEGLGSQASRFFQHAVVTRTTVTALATDLKVGSLDAAIVWDSTALQFGLNTIKDPELTLCSEQTSACLMSTSTSQKVAKDFLRFVTSSQDAEQIFSDLQFQTASDSEQQESKIR
ncbi:MAG: molybdate ABC transporter substrate-binding protein [Fuerstiella sp.]